MGRHRLRLRHASAFLLAVASAIIAGLMGSPASAITDEAFENFACPRYYNLEVDPDDPDVKKCVIRYHPPIASGLAWGGACGRIWEGDIGYFIESPDIPKCDMATRDVFHGLRTYCSRPMAYKDVSLKPPLRRLFPACDDTIVNGTAVFGFGIRRLREGDDPYGCPPKYKANKLVCEDLSGTQPGSAPTVRKFKDVVQQQAKLGQGRVIMSIVTHDYAPLGVAFYTQLMNQNMPNVVLVAMDLSAYIYLTNRGVPAVLKETKNILQPCCLHRWRMLQWRATNDVKVRSILGALDLGIGVTMMDMDVRFRSAPPADMWDKFGHFDLFAIKDYSFMFSYSAPTPAMKEMWQHVLDNVMDGGWDQTQYGYWASLPGNNITQGTYPFSHFLSRAQNKEDEILNSIARHTGQTHPDLVGMDRFVAWERTSECNRPGRVIPWSRRKECIGSLVLAAERLNRTAVVHLIDLYDSHVLRTWFPAISYNAAISNNLVPEESMSATSFTPTQIVSATAITKAAGASGIGGLKHPLKDTPSSLLRLRDNIKDEKVMFLAGDPTKAYRLLKSTCSQEELEKQDMFLLPAGPPRASFPCMRRGGPATEGNPNPHCRKEKHGW